VICFAIRSGSARLVLASGPAAEAGLNQDRQVLRFRSLNAAADNLRPSRTRLDAVRTQEDLVHVSGTCDLAIGRGRTLASNMNRAEDATLRGWSIDSIHSYQSGQPFNIPGAVPTTSPLWVQREPCSWCGNLCRCAHAAALGQFGRLCDASSGNSDRANRPLAPGLARPAGIRAGQPSGTNYTNSAFGSITSLRNTPRLYQLALKLFY
jgi:hypothetical protein